MISRNNIYVVAIIILQLSAFLLISINFTSQKYKTNIPISLNPLINSTNEIDDIDKLKYGVKSQAIMNNGKSLTSSNQTALNKRYSSQIKDKMFSAYTDDSISKNKSQTSNNTKILSDSIEEANKLSESRRLTEFNVRVDDGDNKRNKGSFYVKDFPNPTLYEKIISPKTTEESYIPYLEVSCNVYDPDHLNIIIRDANKTRYEIPYEDPYPHPKNPQYLDIEESNFEFEVKLDPFDLIVKRKSTKEIIFKLTDRLVYTDLYLEFSFNIPTNEIYGLGMRLASFQFKPGTYTLFLLDRAGMIDHGTPGFNGQGHHSMYLMKEKSGNYHTFLLRNVNFGEVTIYKENKIKWQLIGGVLDFNFFLGTTPESAVDKYHTYLEGWTMPALWHLGHHQNKWAGYHNADELRLVLEGYKKKNIPLDTLWTDTEHMIDNINFSIDEKRFPLEKVRDIFESYQKRWIPLFNAHISTPVISPVSKYTGYELLFMRDSLNNRCDGRFLWGKVVFIDFLHSACGPFWDEMIWETDKKWKISGAWLDANEISNLEKREDPPSRALDPYRKYYNLPFYPGGTNLYDLQVINLDCIHHNGQEEYNMRVFNALFQSKYTWESLKKKFPYPFVLGRATMMGGGKYSYTWIPDIWSTWESFIVSLGVLQSYGMFGYGMVGVDVCGFVSERKVDPQICARWYQAAVFYPFARNSHVLDWSHVNNFQEPYKFDGEYFNAIYEAVRLRYSLLKYFYTLFFYKKIAWNR